MPSLLDLYSRLGTDAVQGAKVAGNSLMDFYNKPVVDRASMLPIGQYADGSLTFAVPGMIKDTYDSLVKSYGDVASGRTPKTQDVLNVASAPMMGNFAAKAAGLMPEGALGVGASKPPTAGIRAYHGSPHDFDKFDLSKIGTGEGNTAYGNGLYFADSEDVAKSYRDSLSAPNQGHMYEVNINANPDQFLQWDKPLAEQSESLRNAVLPLVREEAERELQRRTRTNAMNDAHLRRTFGKEPPPRPAPPTVDELAMRMWGNEFGPGNEAAIREAGVPGFRYLDSGSRDAGTGSYNYVVFDPSLVDIQRKYANPAEGSLLSLAQQYLNSQDQKR